MFGLGAWPNQTQFLGTVAQDVHKKVVLPDSFAWAFFKGAVQRFACMQKIIGYIRQEDWITPDKKPDGRLKNMREKENSGI